MSTPPRVFELRLSVIWIETFPTLLASSAAKAPMAFLGQSSTYAKRYDKIAKSMMKIDKDWSKQEAQLTAAYPSPDVFKKKKAQAWQPFAVQLSDPKTLTPPWPWVGSKYTHHFWQYYLENTKPKELAGDRAWKCVVPLRVNIPLHVASPWPPNGPQCKLMVDGLVYPHGVAVILMPRLLFKRQSDTTGAGAPEPGLSPTRAMDYALDARRDASFPVTLPNGASSNLKLDDLAGVLLDYLRDRALGAHSKQGTRPSNAITIATFIQGTGGDPSTPVAANSDLHRVLEGLCNWENGWALNQNLTALDKADLLINKKIPGHMLYHLQHGEAVWMPNLFASTDPSEQRKLNCYHRNLTLAMLQTEMLAQLHVMFTDYLDAGETPPAALAELARFGSIRLSFLYAALKKGIQKYTYNSAAPRAYLDENNYKDSINKARQSFAAPLQPLSYAKW